MRAMPERGISSLSRAARISGISRRALSTLPRPHVLHRRPDAAETRAAVRRVALNRVTYGHRRLGAMLRREGRRIHRRRVDRWMREEQRLRPAHFPRPRLPSAGALEADRPNQKGSTDPTYIDTTDRGPCPLTSILDGCTREVLAWSFLPNCGAMEAIDVVQAAVAKEFPRRLRADGVVLRSDAGSQFIAHVFRERRKVLGIELEAIRKKRREDHGMMESYHGHLKMDYLWTAPPRPYAETRDHLATSLRHYNEERPRSSWNDLTPTEFAKKRKEEPDRSRTQGRTALSPHPSPCANRRGTCQRGLGALEKSARSVRAAARLPDERARRAEAARQRTHLVRWLQVAREGEAAQARRKFLTKHEGELGWGAEVGVAAHDHRAEQGLRPRIAKKCKLSRGSRTLGGAERFAALAGVVETGKMQRGLGSPSSGHGSCACGPIRLGSARVRRAKRGREGVGGRDPPADRLVTPGWEGLPRNRGPNSRTTSSGSVPIGHGRVPSDKPWAPPGPRPRPRPTPAGRDHRTARR